MAKLSSYSSANADGTLLKVGALRRMSDLVDSTINRSNILGGCVGHRACNGGNIPSEGARQQ